MTRLTISKDLSHFLSLCRHMKTEKDLYELLDLFLTIEELETIASRYVIIHALLEEKLTQREIAKLYNVSIAQITRGSNALKIIGPKLKGLLKKQMKS